MRYFTFLLVLFLCTIGNFTNAQTKEEIKEYFMEVALKNEFNKNKVQRIKKWVRPVKYCIVGMKDDELSEEADKIAAELTQLTQHTISRVDNVQEANCIIFFGSGEGYAREVEPAAKAYYKTNRGLFFFNNMSNGEIFKASLYVDVVKLGSMSAKKHLLREEFTQLLGLTNDSYKYPESVFYQKWSYTTEFAPIDKILIQLLYHPKMKLGMYPNEVEEVLEEIL